MTFWFDLSANGKYALSFAVPFSLGATAEYRGFESAKFDGIEFDL